MEQVFPGLRGHRHPRPGRRDPCSIAPSSAPVPFVDEEFPAGAVGPIGFDADVLTHRVAGTTCAAWPADRHPEQHRVGYIAAPLRTAALHGGVSCSMCGRMADEFDLPVMMHVQETRLQVVTGAAFGMGPTPIEYLDRIGFMKPKTQFHPRASGSTHADIATLARTGVSIQHKPDIEPERSGSGPGPLAGAARGRGECQHGATDGLRFHRGHGHAETRCIWAALLQKLRGDYYILDGRQRGLPRRGRWGGAIALGPDARSGRYRAGAAGRPGWFTGWDKIAFVPLKRPAAANWSTARHPRRG